MTSETLTRDGLQRALVTKCWKDPDFKKQVISNPKAMLETYLGQKLPGEIRIFIHEETPDALHLHIPPAPSNIAELSDEGLERVAGGTEIASFVFGVVTLAATLTVGVSVTESEPTPW